MSSLITSKRSVREYKNGSATVIPIFTAVSVSGIDSVNQIVVCKISDSSTDRIVGISIEDTETGIVSEAVTQGIIDLGSSPPSLTGADVNDRIYWDIDNLDFTRIPNQFPIGYITGISPNISLYVDIIGSEISPGDDLRVNTLYADNINAGNVSNTGKIITLNDIPIPSGSTYDGGGVVLKADTGDKTLLYNQSIDVWDSSNSINVPSGEGFKVNNVEYIDTKSTDDLSEGSTNRYYTESYFDASFSNKNTDDLDEGSVNQYYTEDRAKTAVISQSISSGVIDKSPSEDAIYNYIKDSVMSEEIIFDGEINNSASGTLNNVEIVSFSFIRFNNATEVTGFIAPTGINQNKVIYITNVNSIDMLVVNASSGSDVTNRILTGTESDLTLKPNSAIGLIYDRLSERWKILGGTGNGSGGVSGTGVSIEFTSNTNFPLGSPVYFDGTDWNLAIASNETTSVQYIITTRTGSSPFNYTASSIGSIELLTTDWDNITGETGGLIPGAIYYLSSSIAGEIRQFPGLINAPVLRALSITSAFISLSIDNIESGLGDTFLRESFTTIANTTEVTLSYPPGGKDYVWLSLDGVNQHSDAFNVSGNIINFSETIPTDVKIEVHYARAVLLSDPGAINRMVQFSEVVTISPKSSFNLPSVPSGVGSCIVWVGGSVQNSTKWNLNGNVITFIEPIEVDVEVLVVILNSSGVTQIDSYVTRGQFTIGIDQDIDLDDVFGSTVSGRYRFHELDDPRIDGKILMKFNGIGVEPDVKVVTESSDIASVKDTASKINMYTESNEFRIQNKTASSKTLVFYREI